MTTKLSKKLLLLFLIAALIISSFCIANIYVVNKTKYKLLTLEEYSNYEVSDLKKDLSAGEIILLENNASNIIADQVMMLDNQFCKVPIIANDINGTLNKKNIDYADVANTITRASDSNPNLLTSTFYTQHALLFDNNRHLASSRLKVEMEIKKYTSEYSTPHLYMVTKSTMTTYIEPLKGIYKNDKFELKHMNFATYTRKDSILNREVSLSDGDGKISVTRNIASEVNGKLTFSDSISGELGFKVSHSEQITSQYKALTNNQMSFNSQHGYDYFTKEKTGNAYQSIPVNVIRNATYETKMVSDLIFDMTAPTNQDYIYSGTSLTQIYYDGIALAPNYTNDQFSGIFIMAGFRPQTNKRFFMVNVSTDDAGDDQVRWGMSEKPSNFADSSTFYYEET